MINDSNMQCSKFKPSEEIVLTLPQETIAISAFIARFRDS